MANWSPALGALMDVKPKTQETSEGLLTVKETAEHFKMHEKTLYKKVRDGSVPHTRVGRSIRFSRKQLKEYAANAVHGTPRR